MEKVIIKLGGSAITYKSVKAFPLEIEKIKKDAEKYIRKAVVKKLVKEIHSAKVFPLIVVHGVGPFGHFLVKNQNMLKEKRIIHESVAYLNEKIVKYFEDLEIKIKSCAPFDKCIYLGGEKFEGIENLFACGRDVLEEGGILLTYGDIVRVTKGVRGNCEPYQVISGDDLIVYLADLWNAKRIISVTDVDGFFEEDPKINKDANIVKKIRSDDKILPKPISTIDVTGGIYEKIRKLQKVAKKGVRVQIINGLKRNNLKKALLGDESIGTLILP